MLTKLKQKFLLNNFFFSRSVFYLHFESLELSQKKNPKKGRELLKQTILSILFYSCRVRSCSHKKVFKDCIHATHDSHGFKIKGTGSSLLFCKILGRGSMIFKVGCNIFFCFMTFLKQVFEYFSGWPVLYPSLYLTPRVHL